MRVIKLSNGNLELSITPAELPAITECYQRATHKDHGFLADLLEGCPYMAVLPEQVPGALTDAPCITDGFDLDETGTGLPQANGDVWWYPEYQVKSFGEELLATGRTEFTRA